MNDAVRELLKQALKLDEGGRRLLARVLVESVASRPDEIPEQHWEVVEERIREMEENPDDWVSWEELRAELLDEASDAA